MPPSDRLAAAVEAGIVSAEQAERLEAFLTAGGEPAAVEADAEEVRFARGFHDVFLTIGLVVLLLGTWFSAGFAVGSLGAFIAAVLAWVLAEHFTRQRRLVLPSIALALGFVLSCGAGAWLLTDALLRASGHIRPIAGGDDGTPYLPVLAGSVVAVIAAAAFRRRFALPFSLALVAVGSALVAMAGLLSLSPFYFHLLSRPVLLAVGLGTFAVAMRYDMADPLRRTIGADNAFWLHLAAAPLIIHSLSRLIWLPAGGQTLPLANAFIIIPVLLVLGAVAVAIDRRALLVGGLFYFGAAIVAILRESRLEMELVFALAMLMLGAGVVLLGTNWKAARHFVLARLVPPLLARRLPPLASSQG